MTKIQFGSSGNIMDGWLNLQEHDGDITKPLPFKNDSVDFILIEHVLEHVTPLQGFRFLKEAQRILKVGGVIRVIVPDVSKIWVEAEDDYFSFIDESMDQWWQSAGERKPTHPCDRQTAFETILCCHGHKAAYTEELLCTFIEAAGLGASPSDYGKSTFPELNGVDFHWNYMGLERCKLESVVAEGIKL